MELHGRPPEDFEAKSIEKLIDAEPLLCEQLLELASWIAQYYLAPIGEVLRGMLPLTAEVRHSVSFQLADLGRDLLAGGFDSSAAVNSRSRLSPEDQAIEHRVLTRLAEGEAIQTGTLRRSTGATMPLLNGNAAQEVDHPYNERSGA